jgi:hypothetical protein
MLSETALVVTACRRPEYLRRTLASWGAAWGIRDLCGAAVALGASHRLDDQMAVIVEAEELLGRKITVISDSPAARVSPGMHRALGEAIDQVFSDFGAEYVLCGEEDVIVSDDVLTYMAWAQERYDDGMLCICAHNTGGMAWNNLAVGPCDADADQETVRQARYFNPWGWCIRRDRWQSAARLAWDWGDGDSRPDATGYDWQMQRLSAIGPWRNLVPDAARSQNIGEHGGVYSTPDIFPLQHSLSFRERRERPVTYRLADRMPA